MRYCEGEILYGGVGLVELLTRLRDENVNMKG